MAPIATQLDPNRPIGDQLVEEFSRLIATREWKPGQRVPSVRALAVEVGVNPATVQKALVALDERGLLIAESTAGRFVTQDSALISHTLAELAGAHVREFAARMQALGVSQERAIELIHQEWKLTSQERENHE
ncbi:MAG: GntR family transcriptional regulator [Arcanobacterium sp.]|nr:GntR family transcriptional regulator [Arcanobacterium sp.]